MRSPESDASPITLLHFADVHFGVENYGRIDPATGLSSRLIDFKRSLSACIHAAIDAGAEIALFCGDAYKSRDPSQTHQRAFAEAIGELTSAGIPVILLTGNHDIPNTAGKANALEIYGAIGPGMITVLDKPDVVTVKTGLGRDLQIAAVPYLTRSAALVTSPDPPSGVREGVELIERFYEERIIDLAVRCNENPDLPTVLMGHFTVGGAQIAAAQSGYMINEPIVPKSALLRGEFDYIALGHIHWFQDLNYPSQPPLVYCGSPDRIDFGEHAERKGAVLVKLALGQARYEFIPSPARPFLDISIDTTKDPQALAGEAYDPTDSVLAGIAKHAVDGSVVRLSYTLSPAGAPLLREAQIRKALREAHIVVSIRRDIAGAAETARRRVSSAAESTDTLAALGAYIDSKTPLADHKDELMAKARELWQELAKTQEA